jgi:hypothetical protein
MLFVFFVLVYIDCKYNGSKFPICSILTPFFPIEWVPVPAPMGRKKTPLICDGAVFMNLAKFSHTPIKVGLQYKNKSHLELPPLLRA